MLTAKLVSISHPRLRVFTRFLMCRMFSNNRKGLHQLAGVSDTLTRGHVQNWLLARGQNAGETGNAYYLCHVDNHPSNELRFFS